MDRHTLVLTTPPAAAPIDDALLERVCAAVPTGMAPGAPRWLAPGYAVDIPLNPPDVQFDTSGLLAAVRRTLAPHLVDANLVESGIARRKTLLVADMDSTIIRQECIDEIADHAGIGSRVAEITERAMRGELNFESALTERVALLEGVDASALEVVYASRIQLTPGAATLVRTMTAHGAHCALVSGGFTFFTSRIAKRTGFQEDRANSLEIEGGKLTGRVIPPILGREAKLAALRDLSASRGQPTSAALAVGDGANDLAMIREAGLGVAFRAKPVVAAEAAAEVNHSDLTALLFLQGYSADDFVIGAD